MRKPLAPPPQPHVAGWARLCPYQEPPGWLKAWSRPRGSPRPAPLYLFLLLLQLPLQPQGLLPLLQLPEDQARACQARKLLPELEPERKLPGGGGSCLLAVAPGSPSTHSAHSRCGQQGAAEAIWGAGPSPLGLEPLLLLPALVLPLLRQPLGLGRPAHPLLLLLPLLLQQLLVAPLFLVL